MTALELARFALYADIGVVFGVPAAAFLTRTQFMLGRMRPVLAGAAFLGLPLSLLGFLFMVAEMTGTGFRDLDWQLAGELATGIALGWAFLVRMVALGSAGLVSIANARSLSWLVVPSAIALGTLAWSGHAAAGEGALALPHLGLDILHLLAASIWLGALVLFLAMLSNAAIAPNESARALTGFAGIGSALVGVLTVTGLANLWFIAPPDTWFDIAATGYGWLLAAKLALFAGMLSLAALNRFVLTPRLLASAARNEGGDRLRALRISIAVEFLAALAILLVVSRLGLLDPGAS